MRDPDASRLRRYVIRRANGEPHHEYVRYDSDLGAWLLCDGRTARSHERWRRIRFPGRPWCRFLGRDVVIAADTALQAFFETAPVDDWRRMELAVRCLPKRCLREWRMKGARLIQASRAAAEGRPLPGKLAGWPAKRGTGTRSLIKVS